MIFPGQAGCLPGSSSAFGGGSFLYLSIRWQSKTILSLDFNTSRAEVDEQAHILFQPMKIVDQLNLVIFDHMLHRLELNNQFSFNQEIQDKVTYNLIIVIHLQGLFSLNIKPIPFQLYEHSPTINTLQESKAELVIDCIRASNDAMRQLTFFHRIKFFLT